MDDKAINWGEVPNIPLVDETKDSIIKVIGVGGGGSNAVNHMYRKGIEGVSFVVCNTDNQALEHSPVPNRVKLGDNTTAGLGAGGRPEKAREAAEESIERIKKVLGTDTHMVFVTAGMGGGTGTGASPIVAKVAHDMGILTIGIVTIPFAFEGFKKIEKALEGVAELSKHVDAILVINNEKLRLVYPDLEMSDAFAIADDVLANAAKSIAEIITIPGYVNVDFADVYNTMKDGRVAIMNTGQASGENRITKAIEDALKSPIVNANDIKGAKKLLLSFYSSKKSQIKMDEVNEINAFIKKIGQEVDVIWGATFDDSLEDEVKITLIATGFDMDCLPDPTLWTGHQQKEKEEVDEDELDKEEMRKKYIADMYENIDIPAPKKKEQISVEEEIKTEEEEVEEMDMDSLDDIDFK